MKRQLKLKNINLVLLQFRIGRGKITWKEIPHKIQVKIIYDNAKKDNLGVFLDLELGNPSSVDTSNYPFDLKIVYLGSFELSIDEIIEEEIKKIGSINCAAIIFPFLREEVANLVLKSLQRPYLLPPINFVEFYKKNQESIKVEFLSSENDFPEGDVKVSNAP